MSRRPGRIVLSHKIDIPRPRTLATTFEPHFVEIVHELRDRISQEHAP
jgi:NitT/TauT family transport system ATP-binding protein